MQQENDGAGPQMIFEDQRAYPAGHYFLKSFSMLSVGFIISC